MVPLFFDLVVLLKPGALLHKFTFSRLFWNRSLYFGEFSRALLVLSSLVNSPFAELSLQNLRNKWGGGYKGVQTSYLPYIAFPTERPCFSWLPSWSSAPLRLQNSRGLPYPSPYSTNSDPTAPPPQKKTKVFVFKLLYATQPRTGRIETIKCFRCSFRPIMSDVLRHRKRGHFHLLFAECSWQWGIGALHGKSQK